MRASLRALLLFRLLFFAAAWCVRDRWSVWKSCVRSWCGTLRSSLCAAVSAAVTMMFARCGSEANGLDDIERMAGCDAIGGEVIPCAELLDGDAEAIGDGDEGVVAAHGVALTGREAAAGGDGDDEFIAGLDGVGEVIEGGDLGWRGRAATRRSGRGSRRSARRGSASWCGLLREYFSGASRNMSRVPGGRCRS